MKILTDELSALNKIKRRAYMLSEKALIVSKPDQAQSFLVEMRERLHQTRRVYKKLITQVKDLRHLTHEVENLFDNYYIIDGAISDILNNPIDKGFKKLVQVEKNSTTYIPRIYSILDELLETADYKIDRDLLYGFLSAYQSRTYLSIRELSFVPLFLRFILIENIEKIMRTSIISLDELRDADYWFGQITKGGKISDYSKLTSSLASKYGVIPVNLGFNLLQKLSQYGPDTRPIVKWLKLNLLKQGINIADLAEIENRRQTKISQEVGNIINSLRWINQARWDNFIVEINMVDSFLLKDPAGIYSLLDQSSQSTYRNEIVKISDQAGIYESEVAKMALRLCHQSENNIKNKKQVQNHVGYYLVGAGREELEKRVGYQRSLMEKIQSLILRRATLFYLGSVFFISIILIWIFINLLSGFSLPIVSFFSLLILALILNGDIAINLTNIFTNLFIPVRSLFKLDLSSGPTEEQATFVVIPSMLRDQKSTAELLRRLEINFLSNKKDNIYYALLMDFKDSKTENTVYDQELVDGINNGLEILNEKYPSSVKKFYLFHRRRLWNPQEGIFMGWERKRGKLREFNLLLRGTRPTSYFEVFPSDLPKIKYVITIDEDTCLPKDSAIKLIGCIDHPLNRPVIDFKTKKVVSGYGIIQPRMTTRFDLARATIFSRLFSSTVGIDSYTGPAADIYQDLFDNSIFYGKGIYDVDTMEITIGDKIPENQVLSHDLLEGLYTKVGYATDIFLFEGFPESYKEFIVRMNRWIRGDWQIISWLGSKGVNGGDFDLKDKWKIFDNLRRSSLPIFIIFFLFASYSFLPNYYLYSLGYTLLVLGSSFIFSYFIRVFQWPKEMTLIMKIDGIFSGLDDLFIHLIYRFVFILDQAVVSWRATTVSLYRTFISHKYLLRWQNSHEVSKNLTGTVREFVYSMLPTTLLSFGGIILSIKYNSNFFVYITLLFWLISPLIAYQISRKKKPHTYKIRDLRLLRKIACRSARFFLELSRQGGNYLIPDHYQEEPTTNSPAATSPTNIGMHLLSNLSAYDLGYIGFSSLLEQTDKILENLSRMERYRGHFYNWYDIHTLQSLNPKYISSVDSANFLVSVLTLKQGILDIIRKPLIRQESLEGIADVLAVLIEDAGLIIKDRTILRSEKRIAKMVLDEARAISRKFKNNQDFISIGYLNKVLNELVSGNEKIKKIISRLNLGSIKGISASIYSSVEHLNVLLKQQIEDLNLFTSFNQIIRHCPIVKNDIKNKEVDSTLQFICQKLNVVPSFEYLGGGLRKDIENFNLIPLVHSANLSNTERDNVERWYQQILDNLVMTENRVSENKVRYQNAISLLDKFFKETDFAFLYNKERGLFHIGYNVSFDKVDNSFYDFLASEANSISYISILKDEVPLKHWSYLGRKLVRFDRKNVLLSSWGGSLFEYLTSLIFFKVHPDSLLGSTAKLAIAGHIDYGKKYNIPWGMGESAHANLDLNNNYQYQIFGHPLLGFKRDLKDFLVVAPYTTIMALAFKPKEAIKNLRKMISGKFLGRYGFYDAVDYTKDLNNNSDFKTGIPARIYYAHHQGFSLQALNNQINNGRIQNLFNQDPLVKSLDTLFEEPVPSSIPTRPIRSLERLPSEYLGSKVSNTESKQFVPVFTPYPRQAFLSNGTYMINISNTGAGGSRVSDISLTRFREDPLTEPWGQYIYLYDKNKNFLWSPTTQPTGFVLGKNKIEYFENKVRFNKIQNDVESSLTITVAPDSNVEFRSLAITNHAKEVKNLKIMSYGEVALSKANEDLHHTAFQRLFIKSEYLPKYKALIYSRPNKDLRGQNLYFAHMALISKPNKKETIYLTDRSQFLGRGGSLKTPDVLSVDSFQSSSIPGYNFDQIFSLQNEIELKNNETITITYINIFDYNREDLVKNLKKYSNQNNLEQTIKKADKASLNVINSLGLSSEQALNYQILASRLLSPHYSQMVKRFGFAASEAAVQTLWRLGVSGDLPILLVRFYDLNDLMVVKNMLLCHRYLKYKGIAHDLILLNEYPASYIKSFEDEVDFLIRYNQPIINQAIRGNVFHLRASHLSVSDREKLIFLSRVIIDSKNGLIEQQIQNLQLSDPKNTTTRFKPIKKTLSSGKDIPPNLSNLDHYNGLGGFDLVKNEYVLSINYDKSLFTPTAWSNIIANDNIGFVVTENGAMYTWLYDSYDNRLTRRIDDPLLDRSSEVFYLRDEETGEFWNPTPLPIKSPHTYTIKHGLNYTSFNHKSRGIEQNMLCYVAEKETVKIIRFKFKNTSRIAKKMSLTGYFEISLGGANREDTKDYLYTERDGETGALFIRNIFNESFKNCLAFVSLDGKRSFVTNDREEFLGRNGYISCPAAMSLDKISNNIRDDVDPCAAIQTFFELLPGEEKELIVLFGGGQSKEEIKKIIETYNKSNQSEETLAKIQLNWKELLEKIQIKTPDESLNTLFNHRLLYQLISSRLLARTGYNQPSGAYGFRDQLQDSMALVWAKPEMTKEIILKASRHQFLEGDAQNWWHEHNSFGVRSVFSDHQLWLPYVVSVYLEVTGDKKILDEEEPYLKASLLDFINNPNWAGVPEITKERYSLYDHCLRALEKTFNFGPNGLPLIGLGDWNDGLNLVGEKGVGESVWLGWFLLTVIDKFTPYIKERGDFERIRRYEMTANNLKSSLERKAWDGRWYKRAFFDDGASLGSRSNKEFKIDSISQSWSVLSGMAKPDRAKQAMDAVAKYLWQDNLLLLISPAVKNSSMDPGYIRDYPPGVRENGAQYNHAALWAAQAYAKLKDPVMALKILDSINPIKRSADRGKALLYRVEPYVIAGDIYAKPAEAGRGGWTWYTGSAGVMYRTILESILGIKVLANKMMIDPCIPKTWIGFSVTYFYGKTKYNIRVSNNLNVINEKVRVDGDLMSTNTINLIDDGKTHEVEVKI